MVNIKQLPFQREDDHLILSHPEFLTEPQKEALSDCIPDINWNKIQTLPTDISRNVLRILYHSTDIPVTNHTEQLLSKTIESFSLTDNWKLTNFLLPDGRLINGSISHQIRDIDHREIRDILEETERKDYSQVKALTAFLNTGTLRISQNDEETLYLETQTKLTDKQQEILTGHLRKHNLNLQADVSSPSGVLLYTCHCMWSVDIKNFFQTCNQFFDLFEILK